MLLLIEEQERELHAWDFVDCPPGTRHVFVGPGDRPCLIVMMGARPQGRTVHSPRSDLARAHRAGVEAETDSAAEAYASLSAWRVARPDCWGRPAVGVNPAVSG